MTVESLKTIFDWTAVILLFLTFAAGAGVLVTGNIINKRQGAKIRQFDSDLTAAKTRLADQETRAANAEKALKEVKNTAGDADEKAAKATERAAALEVEAKKSQERIEQLRKDNLELEAEASPRVFKDQYGAGTRLAGFAPMSAIIEYLPDRECARTAGQIGETLQSFAKWKLLAVRPNSDENKFFDEVTVQLNTFQPLPVTDKDLDRSIAAADALVVELNKTNIKARAHIEDLDIPIGVLVIRVGLKPNPTLDRLLRDGSGGNVFGNRLSTQ